MKYSMAIFSISILLITGLGGCDKNEMNPFNPSPIKDGRFTILLAHHSGENHVQAAKEHLRNLKQHTDWRDLFVVNDQNYSGVYWGHYKTRKNAESNLQKAKKFEYNKQRFYTKALIVELPGQNEFGPEKWDLRKVPPEKGYYSLMVAVYFDMPEKNWLGRKKRAVDLVRKLREQGEEAYFLHGESSSGVSIGLFPESAIQKEPQQVRHPQTGKYFTRYINLIKPNSSLDRLHNRTYHDLVVNDTGMLQQEINPKTGRVEMVNQRSFPFAIPSQKKVSNANDLPEGFKPLN